MIDVPIHAPAQPLRSAHNGVRRREKFGFSSFGGEGVGPRKIRSFATVIPLLFPPPSWLSSLSVACECVHGCAGVLCAVCTVSLRAQWWCARAPPS